MTIEEIRELGFSSIKEVDGYIIALGTDIWLQYYLGDSTAYINIKHSIYGNIIIKGALLHTKEDLQELLKKFK